MINLSTFVPLYVLISWDTLSEYSLCHNVTIHVCLSVKLRHYLLAVFFLERLLCAGEKKNQIKNSASSLLRVFSCTMSLGWISARQEHHQVKK